MQAMHTITFSGEPNNCHTTAVMMKTAFPQLCGKKCAICRLCLLASLSEQKSDKEVIRTRPLELIGNQEVKDTSHILQSSRHFIPV